MISMDKTTAPELVTKPSPEHEATPEDNAPPKDWPKYIKVKEPWEFQGSDVLKLDPIPGIRRRMLNKKARFDKANHDGGWQVDDEKYRVEIGDLVSGFMPEEKANERNRRFRHKHDEQLQKECTLRQQIYERMQRERISGKKQWSGARFS